MGEWRILPLAVHHVAVLDDLHNASVLLHGFRCAAFLCCRIQRLPERGYVDVACLQLTKNVNVIIVSRAGVLIAAGDDRLQLLRQDRRQIVCHHLDISILHHQLVLEHDLTWCDFISRRNIQLQMKREALLNLSIFTSLADCLHWLCRQ